MSTPRRQFVKAAAAAVATSSFPILGANDRVQVGIVGLGGRGLNHVDYYNAIENARITAVCDVNQAARERAVTRISQKKGYKPAEYVDMRKLFESKDVDAVSLPLPNHWHALATIWACQAGKDVYVEKPASHNMFESRQMVAAARKYKRMVQVGSQSRSVEHKIKAVQMLRDGAIGQVFGARALCFRRRFSIGHTPDEPVPAGVDWDKFLGPAQMKPYSLNKFEYNWHWFWDTGNGDIGNQGVHEMDIALWGLGRNDWPKTVMSSGGKFIWKDDQETPNTQQASFTWEDGNMTFDVRNLPTPPEALAAMTGPNYVGNIFFGDLGFLLLDSHGYQVYKSAAGNYVGARGAGAGGREHYEKVAEFKTNNDQAIPHMRNFLECVKSRDYTKLTAEIEIGAHSASFCHMANIAYRLGRVLKVDANGRFAGDDEANAMQTRNYRAPYVVPAQV
ncbi:MAG: Gfo/Idh/MocA family oxidoreductase [Bryobacterales bacterium]|nr:Gfo/Idh/MocA family oxidoreductase [Bryobacterales bacterium]